MEKSLGSAYVLHDALGRGAMGQVFSGSVRQTGEPVAVKLLRPELVCDPDVVARFIRERTILTSIHDPHVVQVIDLVVEGETLAIVMELVHGTDVRRYLRDRRTLPPAEAMNLIGQLLRGAAAGHAAGIVHRDIKPENMLLETSAPQPVLKLTDFGVARLTHGTSLTRLSSLIGTPEYMAPELAEHDRATPAADVYSAGIVLYEMLCGRTPFAGGHPLAVLRRHVDQAPHRIPGVPPELWDTISGMLAKDPRSRPASAVEAAALLTALQSSVGTMAALEPWDDPDAGPQVERSYATQGMLGRAADETVLRYRDRGATPPQAGGDGQAPRHGSLLDSPGQSPGSAPLSRRKRPGRRAAVLAGGAAIVIAVATTVALAATRTPAPARPTVLRPVAAAVTAKPQIKAWPAKSRPVPAPATPQLVTQPTNVRSPAAHPLFSSSSMAAPPPQPQSSAPLSSAPPTSPASSPTVTYDATEQTLVDSLKPNFFDDCTGLPGLETGIVTAALNCNSVSNGPTVTPLIETIVAGSAVTWFESVTNGWTNNNKNCADGSFNATWINSNNRATEGRLGCYLHSNGELEIVWTVNDDVGFITEGPDSQMYTWWQGVACAIRNGC